MRSILPSSNGGYDRHLRRLCRIYATHTARMAEAVGKFFPPGTRVSRPEGGHFLWVELPEGIDSFSLYDLAMSNGISITPGPIFSATGKYTNCIRLNASTWSARVEQAVETLGRLARGISASSHEGAGR